MFFRSCEVVGSSVVCVCPNGTGTTTSCNCLGASLMVGGYIECAAGGYGECSSCTSQYAYTTCVDSMQVLIQSMAMHVR